MKISKKDVLHKEIVRRGRTDIHHVCNFCGKPLVILDKEKGCLIQKTHAVYILKNGLQLRKCLKSKYCNGGFTDE